MGPFVPRHNKWPSSDPAQEIFREIVVGGRVRLIRRFAFRGNASEDWDRRFGQVGDIGDVVGVHNNYVDVYWPNGADPHFISHVDRNCVEATEDTWEDDEGEWEEDDGTVAGWLDEDIWSEPDTQPRITFDEILRPSLWRETEERRIREAQRTTEIINAMMNRLTTSSRGPITTQGTTRWLGDDDDDDLEVY